MYEKPTTVDQAFDYPTPDPDNDKSPHVTSAPHSKLNSETSVSQPDVSDPMDWQPGRPITARVIELLCETWAPIAWLFLVCKRRLQQADADELLQETFFRLWSYYRAYEKAVLNPTALAWRILHNVLTDFWKEKKRWKHMPLPPELVDPKPNPALYEEVVEWLRSRAAACSPCVAKSILAVINGNGDFEDSTHIYAAFTDQAETEENIKIMRRRMAKYRVDFRREVAHQCPDRL